MSSPPPVYHLFGFISMTPVLWLFLAAQSALVVVAFRLCLVPIKTPRRGRNLVFSNALALPLALVLSVATYMAAMLEAFSSAAAASPNEKAAILASGISTTVNVMWLWIPFVVILCVPLAIQIARHREAAQSRARFEKS